MADVLGRFSFATATTIKQLKNSSNNENTVKSTAFWLSIWKKWCLEKEIAKEIKITSRSSLTLCSSDSTPKLKTNMVEPRKRRLVVSSCTGTQRNQTLTNCVTTPCMEMKTIGIPPCTGTPGQPPTIPFHRKWFGHGLNNSLNYLAGLWTFFRLTDVKISWYISVLIVRGCFDRMHRFE